MSEALYFADLPFYSLIMTAMRKADSDNTELLRRAFPEVWRELKARYNAPGGVLPMELQLENIDSQSLPEYTIELKTK